MSGIKVDLRMWRRQDAHPAYFLLDLGPLLHGDMQAGDLQEHLTFSALGQTSLLLYP